MRLSNLEIKDEKRKGIKLFVIEMYITFKPFKAQDII